MSPKCFVLQADTDGNAWIIGKSGYAPTDGWPSYVLLGAFAVRTFHVVVGKPGFVGGKSHWFPEGFLPGEVGGLLRREGYSSSGERALLFLLKVTGISCESHVLSFLGSLCVCLLSTESIVPSLICDVVRSFLFHCRSWCSDFAAHSILVQDEVLQDTTAGQALRDSWRTAVPNARSLETPERLNEGFPNKNRGVYFVSMLFLCDFFFLPPFLSWRIKVIYLHRTSFFLIGSMIIPGFFGCCFLVKLRLVWKH